MTDKIIIDGVDVSNCNYYSEMEYIQNYNGYTEYPDYCNKFPLNSACMEHPDCYYKQLQRKTAECEELKKAFLVLAEGLNYRQKILDEIEVVLKNQCGDCDTEIFECKYCDTKKISDIISKAKDGEE